MNASTSSLQRIAVCLVITSLCVALPARSQTPPPQPFVDFDFNQYPDKDSEVNAGNDAHSVTLEFKDAKNAKANLHTAAGLGVTGKPTDYAFDNSASATMGGPGPGGVGVSNNSVSGTGKLLSVTFTGWFNTAKDVIGPGARLFDTFGRTGTTPDSTGTNVTLGGGSPAGTLNFGVNGGSVTSDAAYTAKNTWLFYAVTYNSTGYANNVLFYLGSGTSPVTLVSTCSLTKNEPVSLNALCIGNRFSRDRPFQGCIDDFKIFGSATDASGVLTSDQIQAVCDADKGNAAAQH